MKRFMRSCEQMLKAKAPITIVITGTNKPPQGVKWALSWEFNRSITTSEFGTQDVNRITQWMHVCVRVHISFSVLNGKPTSCMSTLPIKGGNNISACCYSPLINFIALCHPCAEDVHARKYTIHRTHLSGRTVSVRFRSPQPLGRYR